MPNTILGAGDRAMSKETALVGIPPKNTALDKYLLTVTLEYYSLEQEWEIEKNKAWKEEKPF